MLNWRSTLPDIEDAGGYAMDQLLSAAKSVSKSASDGYKSLTGTRKSDAAFWGAITLGMGACAGGLFALWRFTSSNPRGKRMVRDGKRMVRSVSKSIDKSIDMGKKRVAGAVAAANRDMNRFMRTMPIGMSMMSKPNRKRSRKTTRSRSRRRAAM